MIEFALALMESDIYSAKLRQEQEKKWWDEYKAASPEIQTIMLKVRREMAEEAKIERRHQEQIRAQHEIADAIRDAARPRYHHYF